MQHKCDGCIYKSQPVAVSDMNYTQMRPCLANGKEATFHRWSVKVDLFLKANSLMKSDYMTNLAQLVKKDKIIPPHFDTETIQRTVAIVEYEDGAVDEVEPTKIKFICDDKVTRDYITRSKEVEIR